MTTKNQEFPVMNTKQHANAHESTHQNVTVEDFEDRKIVHVGSLGDLTQWKNDPTEEPRMSVTDMAKRASRPADEVRRVARAWQKKSENFNPFEIRLENGTQGPDFTELYLSEAEVLFLCTKLRGEVPEKITWEMVDVYMKARRGLLPAQGIDPSLVLAMRQVLEEQRQEVRALQAECRAGLLDLARQNSNLQAQIVALQQSHESGVIGARLAKTEINAPLADYARIMARVDLSQGFRAHCSRSHTELRDELEYPAGLGADWRYLSREKFGKAQRVVRKMLSRAIKALNAMQATESKKATARQSSFRYDN